MEKSLELVARTSFRILCDHSDSEYVTEAVLDYMGESQPHEGTMPSFIWLMRQTIRFSRKRYFRNKVIGFFGNSPKVYVQAAPKVEDVDDYITTQAWEVYCRACENMSLDHRVVYVLREIECLSEEETMQVTDFWRSTVRLALETARVKVRHELDKFGRLSDYDAYIGFLRKVKDSQSSCSLTHI